MDFSTLTEQLMGLGTGRWAIHHRAVQKLWAGEDVVMLSIGEPQLGTPAGIVDTAVESLRTGRTKYAIGRGEPALLEVIADRYTKRSGRVVGTDQVTFFPGSHTALYALCQTLLEAGDHILVPDPFYAAYEGIIRASRAEMIPVPLRPENRFHLEIDALEKALTPQSRVLILNNPHNPTGAVLSRDRVREVAEFCRRHDLWLISDEAYEQHVYEGEFVSPFDMEEFSDRIAVICSVSKSHAMTGWRCGWAVGSPELLDHLVAVSEAMMFGAQPFLQDATAYALTHHFDDLDHMIADYARRARLATELIAKSDAVTCHMPQGGIFVMVDVRSTGLSGDEFASRLLEDKLVATMPGESFGRSGAGHVRISLTAADESITTGCNRVIELAESLTS
ncbi:MAG: aminotransferase class I/II-fold pyridoxal phosphate-dependent enzyme [bacterium]|nr:aminotransferase class I/II-fold pyridoxal phosphate-dependent enzyme [bacterium]